MSKYFKAFNFFKSKVSPTIKSVKPTKDISGSVKRVTQNVSSKRIRDVENVRSKIKTGKQMIREGQKERKRLVDTGRAFKFRGGKEVYSIRPGENPKVKFKSTIAKDAGRSSEKKFKKGKELEKKADGGRIGRRFGSPNPKKTNIEKIKETFGPKAKNLKPVDPKKQKGLAKLPKQVRNKMGYMKSGGRAGFKGGGADTGRIGQLKSDLAIAKNTADNKAALKKADQDRNKFDKVAKADFRDRNK